MAVVGCAGCHRGDSRARESPREGSPLRLKTWPFCALLNSCGAFRFGTELGHDRRTVWRAQSFLYVTLCVFEAHLRELPGASLCFLFALCKRAARLPVTPCPRHAGVNPPVGNQVTLLYGKDAMCPNGLEKCCQTRPFVELRQIPLFSF